MISQDYDSTHDEPVLGLVGTAFDDVQLDQPVEEVMGRGRRLRRRRQAMPALATAGILAASLSLAAVTQSGQSSGHNLAYNGAVVNVDEAGFSVHTDAKTGKVTVTLDGDELTNPSLLKQVLAKAGIPSLIRADTITSTTNTTCIWRGAKQLPYGEAILTHTSGNDSVVAINRDAMPRGSVVAFEITTYPQKNGGTLWGSGTFLLSNMPTGCTK